MQPHFAGEKETDFEKIKDDDGHETIVIRRLGFVGQSDTQIREGFAIRMKRFDMALVILLVSRHRCQS